MRATQSKRFQAVSVLVSTCGLLLCAGCGTGEYEQRMQKETISALQDGAEPPGAKGETFEPPTGQISGEEIRERIRAATEAAAAARQAQPPSNDDTAPAAQPPADQQ